MKKIGIKQLQRNLYKELNSFPLVITKDGKDWLLITALSENEITKGTAVVVYPVRPPLPPTKRDYSFITARGGLQEDVIDPEPENVDTGKCHESACRGVGPKYRVSYPQDEGLVTKEYFLCGFHAERAKQMYEEVMELE